MGDFVHYYLKPTKKEDMVRLVDYVTEATRKHSLDSVGEDITIKDYDHFDPLGFKILESFFLWREHTSNKNRLDIDALENEIATHFPDVEFIREVVMNNETLYHTIGRNGKWEKLTQPMDMYVFFGNEEQLNLIVSNRDAIASIDGLKENVKENNTELFVKISFGNLPESKLQKTLDSVVAIIGQLLPESELPCITIKWYDYIDCFDKKAVIKAGKAEWQDLTREENSQLESMNEEHSEVTALIMKRDYLKLLFK